MLANQFRQHSSAVDLEFLLDVLGQDFPELVRVDTTARRRATQEQLDWSEGPAFFLGALTAAASPTEDEVDLQAWPPVCNLAPYVPMVAQQLELSCCVVRDACAEILHVTLLAECVCFRVQGVDTDLFHVWGDELCKEQEDRRASARLGAAAAYPWQHVP